MRGVCLQGHPRNSSLHPSLFQVARHVQHSGALLLLSLTLLTGGQHGSTSTIPILQLGKLRHKEAKGHTALNMVHATLAHAAEPNSRTDAPRKPAASGPPVSLVSLVTGRHTCQCLLHPTPLASQVSGIQWWPRRGQALWYSSLHH